MAGGFVIFETKGGIRTLQVQYRLSLFLSKELATFSNPLPKNKTPSIGCFIFETEAGFEPARGGFANRSVNRFTTRSVCPLL